MKHKSRLILTALVVAASSMAMWSCSSSDNDSDSSSSSGAEVSSEEETTEYAEPEMSADPNVVPASGAKPVLAASSAEGKAGETVDVTVSITGAEGLWAMCGVHLTYDENLVCVAESDDEKTPEYTKGEAIEDMNAFISLLQIGDDRNEYLIENKLNAVFFTVAGSGNNGHDGDIVTYQFTIPEDAQAGTEYEIGFYYRNGDMFTDIDSDDEIQDYAFSHYQTGKITVV